MLLLVKQEKCVKYSFFFSAVTNASTSVANSKRLRTLLQVVLAVGNYLNYEKRNGNASGKSLKKLCKKIFKFVKAKKKIEK